MSLQIVFRLVSVFLCLNCIAQNTASIRFKKDPGFVLFFQKSKASDTIKKNLNDVFYLLIADSMKLQLVLDVENGELIKEPNNDSLVKLVYLPGLKYECGYKKPKEKFDFADPTATSQNKKPTKTSFQTLINGTSALSHGKIKITLRNNLGDFILFERVYFFKSNQ